MCLNSAVSTLRGVPILTLETVLISVRYKTNALSRQGPEPSSLSISTIAPGGNIVLLLPASQIISCLQWRCSAVKSGPTHLIL